MATAGSGGVGMWKIFIEYSDKSKATLTGKHADIPLRLAVKYYNDYVAGKDCKATYQRYPVKNHKPVDLYKKIEELMEE